MALVAGGVVLAERSTGQARGQAENLAAMTAEVLAEVGHPPGGLAAVGVTTGPGSFTGLRASIAVASGLAAAAGVPLFGVPVADALALAVPALPGRTLWVVLASRGGRAFLVVGDTIILVELDAPPRPDGPVALAGDAAPAAHAALLAMGADAVLTAARRPRPIDMAVVAAARLGGAAPRRGNPVLPLYAERAAARLLAGPVRPPPAAPPERVGQSHAGVLAHLHAACFPAAERWDEAAVATLLGQPGVFAWLDPAGGFVLARVAADEAELVTLAVTPDARRRGRGRALVRAARAEAARRGAVAMFLEVGEANAPARALYATCGFVPVGRRPAYYPDGGDALLLRAPLG